MFVSKIVVRSEFIQDIVLKNGSCEMYLHADMDGTNCVKENGYYIMTCYIQHDDMNSDIKICWEYVGETCEETVDLSKYMHTHLFDIIQTGDEFNESYLDTDPDYPWSQMRTILKTQNSKK